MSQDQNIELVERVSDAFARRDVEAYVECFHPSVEYVLPRNLLEGGSYRGLDGVRRAYADFLKTWDDYRFQREDVRAIGDYVVLFGRATIVGKSTAQSVELQAPVVFKIQHGKIIKFQPYTSHAEALKAVGLEE